MKCEKCSSENLDTQKFCGRCGARLGNVCPKCGFSNPLDYGFCGECGSYLGETLEEDKAATEMGERKYVSVLFSDLSGYTALSEKLDPEEVKEIMSRIFGEIAQIVAKYEGFIEKFVGDAVVALFGVPKSHEDDPIRAIKAAREIHDIVEALSPEVERKIGRPISMHSGINTGLVVTGKVDTEKGVHGVSGDTINLASRLQGLAKRGEILVGQDTYRQAEGYFIFESMEPTVVKGKVEPVQFHKVLSQKDKPVTTHRLSGMRADLIGRKLELEELKEAVANLKEGKGRIFSICGDAGTGKSRLVEDFKTTLDLGEIQWIEGHAYAYSQNMPYFPLIDLLNRVFHIEENDTSEAVRDKVESGMENLLGKSEDLIPYVGSLYSLDYSQIKDVSPEFWRSRLQEATQAILRALAKKSLTVFFLEDLHWSDPSFVELFRRASLEIQQPAIVLCVYRPTFTLFTSHQAGSLGKVYREIRLQDLSLSEAQDMLASLLKTDSVPADLKRLIQTKTEGNPFYLEELVNSLIESGALLRDEKTWRITRSLNEMEIPSSIHGLISGRLDRLEKETKRILQEASVIGRAFLYEILLKITELKDRIEPNLSTLERLDLIRTRSLQPDLEYMFKHPLTQEVVYSGLLKKERQKIHEQIGNVVEQLFKDRLPEFYETLAFHFTHGGSVRKAVGYLMRSAEKSLARYALEESHRYYREAFALLSNKPGKSREENELLIDLVVKWALVFYYRGNFRELTELLKAHEDLARSLDDKARQGMFLAWLGFNWWSRGKIGDSYDCLSSALKIGEEINDRKLIGYSCAWLVWSCSELGLLREAIVFGERAQEIARLFEPDQYLYFKSLAGLGRAYILVGECRKAADAGEALLDYGRRHSNIRSLVLGHLTTASAHWNNGDFTKGVECCKEALRVSQDPYYSLFSRAYYGVGNFASGQLEEAQMALSEAMTFSRELGAELTEAGVQPYLGAVFLAKGQMTQGLKMLEEARAAALENKNRFAYVSTEYILGKVFSLFALGGNDQIAGKKAEDHLNEVIRVTKETGMRLYLGRAYLDLGLLHKSLGETDRARGCFSDALGVFEQCDAEYYRKQASEALASQG